MTLSVLSSLIAVAYCFMFSSKLLALRPCCSFSCLFVYSSSRLLVLRPRGAFSSEVSLVIYRQLLDCRMSCFSTTSRDRSGTPISLITAALFLLASPVFAQP
uniref:Putative secreted protein n=1 Tax=Rhipicephalus microplus TaxID=6941 RepID=A0A6M2D9T6_RHIMP